MGTTRTFARDAVAIAAIAIAAGSVSADAPHPVEAGEFYLEGALGYQNFDRPDAEHILLYRDDSSQTPTGEITISVSGFLDPTDPGTWTRTDLAQRGELSRDVLDSMSEINARITMGWATVPRSGWRTGNRFRRLPR